MAFVFVLFIFCLTQIIFNPKVMINYMCLFPLVPSFTALWYFPVLFSVPNYMYILGLARLFVDNCGAVLHKTRN